MKDKYMVKMDDDCFLETRDSMERWYRYMEENPNTMLGVGGFSLLDDHKPQVTELCRCNYTEPKSFVDVVDHVAYIVMMRSWSGKIMHRFRPYAHIGAEDVAVSVANS